MHYRCVFSMLEPCVLVGLDWAEPMMFLLLHVTCLCIFHTYVPFFSFFLYYCWLVLFCFSLSLSLSLSLSFFRIVCAWHLSANSLHPRTFFVSRHLLLLILHLLMSGSVMIKPVRTFRRTFLNVAFIRNAMLSYWTSLILIYWLSYISGDGSLFVRS